MLCDDTINTENITHKHVQYDVIEQCEKGVSLKLTTKSTNRKPLYNENYGYVTDDVTNGDSLRLRVS